MEDGTVETPEELLAKQHRKEKKDLQGSEPRLFSFDVTIWSNSSLCCQFVYISFVVLILEFESNLVASNSSRNSQ